MALTTELRFPALTDTQATQLRDALGPMVALSNPLDYHTYIWRDAQAMAQAWGAMTGGQIDLTLSIVDYPTTDPTDWDCATQAALAVRGQTGAPFAIVASLPELLPPDVAERLMRGGVVPMMGLHEALEAIAASTRIKAPVTDPICLPGTPDTAHVLDENASKQALAQHGLRVPQSHLVSDPEQAEALAQTMPDPLVVKGVGLAHKSDSGAVRLGVCAGDVGQVMQEIGTTQILLEEMIQTPLAELLVGVLRDPAHGFVLTLGAGGVQTEILRDTVSLLLPATADDIWNALQRLKIAPLLNGYRGNPACDRAAIVRAIEAVQSYVIAHADQIEEVEINPLLCTVTDAVAVDALIRKA
jgi:acetyl-CoA synthetase